MKRFLAIIAMGVAATWAVSARTAPQPQIECVYDGMSSSQILSMMQGIIDTPKAGESEEDAVRRKMKPAIDRCASQYQWTDTDRENAFRFTYIDVMGRLTNAILKSNGVDTNALYRFYKQEPLTVEEMHIRMADDAYAEDLGKRLIAANLAGKDGKLVELSVQGIVSMMLGDLLLYDFADGVLRD